MRGSCEECRTETGSDDEDGDDDENEDMRLLTMAFPLYISLCLQSRGHKNAKSLQYRIDHMDRIRDTRGGSVGSNPIGWRMSSETRSTQPSIATAFRTRQITGIKCNSAAPLPKTRQATRHSPIRRDLLIVRIRILMLSVGNQPPTCIQDSREKCKNSPIFGGHSMLWAKILVKMIP